MPENPDDHENLGRRIAGLRAKQGWTQQQLAERLAISRVAVSHLESGLTVPGERTVALLASVFKLEPHDLVAGTTYPAGKAERLPVVVARYTEAELQLELLDNDLRWLESASPAVVEQCIEAWQARLSYLADVCHDSHERVLIADARRRVRDRRVRQRPPADPTDAG
jgi:transcriptional regulator with XRE-family HTH domain